MEIEITNYSSQPELKLYRSFMNSKIDIFQDSDGYVFRNDGKVVDYSNSYERRQNLNESAKILSDSSSLLLHTLGSKYKSVEETKYRLRTNFSIVDPGAKYNSKYIENDYMNFKRNVMMKKLENDEEFKKLCEFIEHPRFHEVMIRDWSFLNYILNHKYIKYHPKYEELAEKYSSHLCPNQEYI
jgi:hypothetical protein